MCNRYTAPEWIEIEREWHITGRNPVPWTRDIFPRAQGPFIRRARDATEYKRELAVGQWGLIPWFAKTPRLTFSTNNARSEELADKATFRDPWKRSQRCIIPAADFFEPNWESGKNQWWRFRRADGTPWSLAGLWSTWTDKETREVYESYTMLTLNCTEHPLMNRMHRPVLDATTKQPLPLEQQDKRSVIPIERGDVNLWLSGTVEQAQSLLKLAPVSLFYAGPA